MNKKALRQYCILRRELDQLNIRIKRLSKELKRLEKGAAESDVVTRGKRGKKPLGTVTVTGYPDRRYQKLKRQRTNALIKNKALAEEIEEQLYEVDQFICSVKDSEMRQILRMLCLSDEYLTWQRLANELNKRGGMYTDESVRKKVERFLNE